MLNMMEKLNKHHKSFTETEIKIYDYIRNHVKEIAGYNISELAEATNTSTSAITRFVQKTGYDKYVDFRLDVERYLAHYVNISPEELLESEDFDEQKSLLSQFAVNTIDEALSCDNESAIKELVDCMAESDLIIVFGTGLSLIAAESFYQKSLRSGLRIHIVRDTSTAKDIVRTHKGKGLLLAISNSGISREILDFTNFAKEHDFAIASMTRSGKNDIKFASDLVIELGDTMSSLSAINSYIYAQLVLVDLIFILFVEKYDLVEEISTWGKLRYK